MTTKGTPSSHSNSQRRRTCKAKFRAMVLFLEVPDNFQLITVSSANGKPMTARQKLSKSAAYKSLTEFVNQILDNKDRVWKAEDAKSRYESYIKLYKKTKMLSEQTGFGLLIRIIAGT